MTSRRLNVLHVVLSFRPGGRRNAIVNLAAHLKTAADCHLCCLDELGCEIGEIRSSFTSITTLERRQSGYFTALRRLARLCAERGIDIIHAHDAASQYMGTLARISSPSIKLLMTFHRTLGFESAHARDKLRNAFCGIFSQAVVTASLERKQHFLSENFVAPHKVAVIPFGTDVNRFQRGAQSRFELRDRLGVGERAVLIGTIGHFGPEKGIDQAVVAFGQYVSRYPNSDVALVVLGDGTPSQRERIATLIRTHPRARIIVAGYQTDVPPWLSAMDVFLHTPRLEAFGLVVIEAMASELPVIATAVGSMPEIVRDEETGLITHADGIDAIVDCLARLVPDNTLKLKLGARAREVAVAEYSSTLCASRYLMLYEAVCTKTPRSSKQRHPQAHIDAAHRDPVLP